MPPYIARCRGVANLDSWPLRANTTPEARWARVAKTAPRTLPARAAVTTSAAKARSRPRRMTMDLAICPDRYSEVTIRDATARGTMYPTRPPKEYT